MPKNHIILDRCIKEAVDALIDGTVPNCSSEGQALVNNFLSDNEQFFVLADFEAYLKAQEKIEQTWAQKRVWQTNESG